MSRPRALTCPPGITEGGVDSIFGAYAATVRASTDYWTSALRRRARPLDVAVDLLQWYSTALGRRRPAWATPHEIVAEWPIARLRDFSGPNESDRTKARTGARNAAPAQVATLFLPPQAGHDSCIVDFAPRQSQIATARAAGLTRVFSLDWIGATAETKDASIDDYLSVLVSSVEQLGGRVNLVGDCQGGWLAVIYAALYPETINTLTIAGAPVDFHAGDPLIHDWMQVLSPAGDLDFYRALVTANGGLLPGELLLAGFIAMQPEAEVVRQLQLLAHLQDAEYVDRYRIFEDWFKHTQPIPGNFYLWIVEHLFQNNELIAGSLVVGGRPVQLANITAPLYLLAGTSDHITPAAQVFALAGLAGTAPEQVDQLLASGGHLGLFMGHEALREHWAPLFASIATRSG